MAVLEPARMDHLPGQINPPPPPVIVRSHEEWFVEEILDSRWHRGTLLYWVSDALLKIHLILYTLRNNPLHHHITIYFSSLAVLNTSNQKQRLFRELYV